jgi:hypothetical protein
MAARLVPSPPGPPWLSIGSAGRLFAESHVKKRLHQLSVAYLQLDAALSVVADAAYREWLKTARETTDAFADTFSSFRGLRIWLGATWPTVTAALALVGVKLSFPRSISDVSVAVIGLLILIELVPYLYLFLRSSFLVKRDLLLPGARWLERLPAEDQRKAGGHVYQAERELFTLLKRPRRSEAPVDAIGLFIVLLVPAALAVFLIASALHLRPDSNWVLLIGSFALLGAGLPPVLRSLRREWR